jgi:TonB family protein
MAANAIENLARWNLQIALLVIVAAGLVPLLRMNAPTIRHAFWRSVVVACLLLPVLQPWRSPIVDSSMLRMAALEALSPTDLVVQVSSAGRLPLLAWTSRHVRENWASYAGAILACGVALRLAWLVIGIHRLQRLRRMGELAMTGEGFQELTALLEAGAEIRRVDRLGQPVTFGVLKPAVLLPASFSGLPADVQRAVLAHELWHVRRRDWAWVLLEETIRAAFWFNPAMWWLVSRVQSSREEVVDELTVQLTNARRTYLEALLVFADQPTLFPATPFARRRHLFQRMLLISREAVMSSRRIVASSVAMAAVLLATGLYASSTFPLRELKGAPVSAVAPPGQNPPRDRRPGEAGPETARERELKKAIEASPTNSDLYFQLAGMQVSRGAPGDADATMQALKRALPDKAGVDGAIAGFYARTGQFERAIATLENAAAANPSNAEMQQMVATFYWEKAFKDQALSPAEKLRYVDAGLAASDRALSARPDYSDALVYKNILLRTKATMESDPVARQALLVEADALRNRAIELKKTTGQDAMVFVPAPGQPPPPPPPPPPAELLGGQAPVRVGGSIKPPAKTRDVKPIYPEIAMNARVQGVVIIEVTIDQTGNVAQGRVLRGQPLLDLAALEAVNQWQFVPTLLNGVAVPVIMTVTVNFTLDRGPAGGGQADLLAPPPPPPPPAQLVDGQAPVRPNGNVKPPVKVRDVRPIYPADAMAGNVQGVVILEATLDSTGNVRNARVLRGQPLLDAAAVEAVQQWQYTPTLLNGVAVPVIITVTVNFTMDK